MRHLRTVFALAAVAALGVFPARASIVYSQDFDTTPVTFSADTYWADNANDSAFICPSTDNIFCAAMAFSNDITADVSGSGNFLFEGTAGTIPTGQTIFFESPSFTVVPFTQYTVSFFLTNANDQNNASVQADINGLLGSPVTASGFYSDGTASHKWQQFSVTWNSGANTSAQLILHDFTTTTVGNDFGVDAITVTSSSLSVPEPGTLALFCGGCLAGLAWARRKRGR